MGASKLILYNTDRQTATGYALLLLPLLGARAAVVSFALYVGLRLVFTLGHARSALLVFGRVQRFRLSLPFLGAALRATQSDSWELCGVNFARQNHPRPSLPLVHRQRASRLYRSGEYPLAHYTFEPPRYGGAQ